MRELGFYEVTNRTNHMVSMVGTRVYILIESCDVATFTYFI